MVTTERQKPAALVHYVTVRDAVERLNTPERTIRRWIEKGKLTSIRDAAGFVRIDLADIEQILQDRPTMVPSLQEQVTSLLTRIEDLEDQMQEQSAQIAVLRQQLEQGGGQRHHVHAPAAQSTWEKRGLPEGTEHLVTFVKMHQPQNKMTIYAIKQLFAEGKIALTIYQREEGAQRNKQEWWITREQHLQLVEYFQQHAISYSPCTHCKQMTAHTLLSLAPVSDGQETALPHE